MVREINEYVDYEGDSFTIEWYYDNRNCSAAWEHYNSLDANGRIKVLKLFKRMGDHGEIRDVTKFMTEGDKIYAFKPQPDRFLCFFHQGDKIIVTNGFRKKQQKLPKREKERAMRIRDDGFSPKAGQP
ncbi:MAG: type II toxin-antitoxin system RelE/ParE family toxin [Gammaproteobacteria bacterium]|nr:type II toxin-antitoxin system RelE/ParE family toxin [Gammaproteobacteria bacterium]